MTAFLFRGRAFVSLLMLFSFVVMAVSGVALFAAPRGPARDWLFLALGKHDWVAVHVVFSVLFMVLALVHVFLNRKPLISYLKRKMESVKPSLTLVRFRWELLVALAVCLLIGLATLKEWPPTDSLLNLRAGFRDSVFNR